MDPAGDSGEDDDLPPPTSRVRGLSLAFEPEEQREAARMKRRSQNRAQSVVAEKFAGFSEDDDEAIIIKVASDSWQVGFAGEDAPK